MVARDHEHSLRLLMLLCHHRWAIPVLAELQRSGGGSKFITLTFRLKVSKSSLASTLARLIDLGWIERNPGYGHPMRPEYILTRSGTKLAPWCAGIYATLKRLRAEDALLRKWSLPIALALHHGCSRFAELRSALPDITSRALTLTLTELIDAGVTKRRVHDDAPPRVEYQLAPAGKRLGEKLRSLPC